jgi:hypothetical protein
MQAVTNHRLPRAISQKLSRREQSYVSPSEGFGLGMGR